MEYLCNIKREIVAQPNSVAFNCYFQWGGQTFLNWTSGFRTSRNGYQFIRIDSVTDHPTYYTSQQRCRSTADTKTRRTQWKSPAAGANLRRRQTEEARAEHNLFYSGIIRAGNGTGVLSPLRRKSDQRLSHLACHCTFKPSAFEIVSVWLPDGWCNQLWHGQVRQTIKTLTRQNELHDHSFTQSDLMTAECKLGSNIYAPCSNANGQCRCLDMACHSKNGTVHLLTVNETSSSLLANCPLKPLSQLYSNKFWVNNWLIGRWVNALLDQWRQCILDTTKYRWTFEVRWVEINYRLLPKSTF